MRKTTSCFRAVLLLLAFLCPLSSARACLNDRDSDSLEYEAKALPETVRVLTGRFDRNPPLFYEVRLRRVAQEIAAHPERLWLFDDAAVACDRLGRDDEAIAWIEKKRVLLAPHSTTDQRFHDAWYRYYANVGTFRAHRWLRAGADRARIGELKQAQAEIARAVALYPNAHLGREWAQQWVMAWIAAPKKPNGFKDSLGVFLEEKRGSRSRHDVIQALAGLVVLGNAWESVDVTGAIGYLLTREEENKVALLAKLRCIELLEAGKPSLVDGKAEDARAAEHLAYRLTRSHSPWSTTNQENVKRKYQESRAEADEYQRLRTAYAVTRLNAGQHPDTDPQFWAGFHPAPAPSLAIPWTDEVRENAQNGLLRMIYFGPVYLVLGLPVLLTLRAIVRRLNARARERRHNQMFHP